MLFKKKVISQRCCATIVRCTTDYCTVGVHELLLWDYDVIHSYCDILCNHSDSGWKETVVKKWFVSGKALWLVASQAVLGVSSLQQRSNRLFSLCQAINTALYTWSQSGCGCSGRRRSSEPWNTRPSAAAAAPDRRCQNHQTVETRPCKARRRLPPPQNLWDDK